MVVTQRRRSSLMSESGAHAQGGAAGGGGEGGARSSDSSGERARGCMHVAKSVDLNKLRKAIKKNGIASACTECPPVQQDQGYEEDNSVWVCLNCGTQLCGRMRNKHALKHFETPHSDHHAIAARTRGTSVYCYSCNGEVDPNSHKKLKEALSFIQKEKISSPPESETETTFSMYIPRGKGPSASNSTKYELTTPGARRVRGLTNLGNTCFFNSVMQCLVQTPYLVDVLKEMSKSGQKFKLPGGTLKLKKSDNKKEDEEEEEPEREIELPPICGELDKWGDLTETLADTLGELQIPGKYETFSPIMLFRKFETKMPQFAGGDQHDSHELLRHLLEAVRNEDLCRYKYVILEKLGLDSKEKRSDIDEETKQKVKFYGQQASDTMLRPGQVFRGVLVSTLQCQDCNYSSHTNEHFLDLSLPVTADKPQPPAVTRRKTHDDDSNNTRTSDNDKSSHQLRKEKHARKYKNKKGVAFGYQYKNEDSNQNGDANENKVENKSSSEQSDADVEDNIDENSKYQESAAYSRARDTASNFAAYYMESGYNSEKVISSDSIRASPDLENKEKSDISPERPDKELNDLDNISSTIIPLPYKSLANDDSQPSNPDSGVASPETAKHALSDTVNVESPITSKELGSPTSLSSEINMDMSSPRQSNNSPVGGEMDRPVSRISFNNRRMALDGPGEAPTVYNADENGTEPPQDDKLLDILYKNSPSLHLELNITENQENNTNGTSLNNEVPRLSSPDQDCFRRKKDSTSNLINTVSPRYQCDDGEISIQSCLNQFTSSELLTGSNKVGCEACTKRANNGKQIYTNATKRFLISNPPAVLILHLKRFQLGTRCMLRKVTKSVNFPTVLDIAPFCSEKVKTLPSVSPNQSKILYSLYGVVEHSGGMHLGHYVAYVKVRPEVKPGDVRWRFLPKSNNDDEQDAKSPDAVNGVSNDNDTDSSLSGYESGEGAVGGCEVEPPSGKWFYISDTTVRETTEEAVLKVQAYLLFYERIL